ncbi:MAG TPA: ABC transporter permease [Candidatus Dormibacteraeota bacterium]|nr:ABC transporter permease [Candidatus Dormibacteraeota bacterium]
MWSYVLRRIGISIPILLLITVGLFGLLQLTPGGPLDALAPPEAPLSPQARAALGRALGLDQPLPVRYAEWLSEAVRGNLGYRSDNGEPVSQAIGSHIGPTLELMGTGILIGIIVGILLGVISAVYQYSIFDMVLTVLAFLGISLPAFLAGLLGLYFFSIQLGWFPSGGITTPGTAPGLGQNLMHLVLPALLLSINQVAQIMRYTRASMLEVIEQDYVRTARAKGAGSGQVVVHHALRNALLPVITIIGASIPNLVGGAVFLEAIFSWPGMGQLFLTAVQGRDYSLIMGMTLILAIVVLLANLLTDLAYAAADPRIRYGT